jgi:hypothetical protein
MKKFMLLAVILLSGCATAEKYEAKLKTWIGSSESALVSSWGPPDSVYENGGLKYLTYSKSVSGYIPGTAPTYQTRIIGNQAYTSSYGGSPGFAYSEHCKTTFIISEGTIDRWRYEGDACVSD